MRKKIGIIFGILGFIGGVLYPLYYWMMNPDLTQIQLFLNIWYIIVPSFVAINAMPLVWNSDEE